METSGNDRRRHSRRMVIRPCKLHMVGRSKLSPGETSNLSASGALLLLSRDEPLEPGSEVRLAISWDAGGVVREQQMLGATVRRVMPIDSFRQAVGVEFDHLMEHAGDLAAA